VVCVSDVRSFEIVCLIFETGEAGGGGEFGNFIFIIETGGGGGGGVNSAILFSLRKESFFVLIFPQYRKFNIALFSACLIVLGFSEK